MTETGFSDAASTKRFHEPGEAILKSLNIHVRVETLIWLQNPLKSTAQLISQRSLQHMRKAFLRKKRGRGGKRKKANYTRRVILQSAITLQKTDNERIK